jgi:hypothetical protein
MTRQPAADGSGLGINSTQEGPGKGAILQGFGDYVRPGAGEQVDGHGAMRGRITRTGGCLALAAALSGCATDLDTGNLYIQPGKFQFLKCPDLTQRFVAASAREKEIVALMERAGSDAVGTLIGATTYAVDLKQTRAEAQLLQQTMREKNCPNTVPTQR